ncbi:MAG: hypothetical protein ACT4NV_20195, partial [Rhodoferax sp.]
YDRHTGHVHRNAGHDPGIPPVTFAGISGHDPGIAGHVRPEYPAAIFTALALRDQVVPGTLNLHEPDALAQGLDLVALQPRRMALEYAMCNGFGFGGVNASLVLRRWGAQSAGGRQLG